MNFNLAFSRCRLTLMNAKMFFSPIVSVDAVTQPQDFLLLPFEKIDRSHMHACGVEGDFDTAISHIVNVLDPHDEYRLMGAAIIVFGNNSARGAQRREKLVNGSVIDAWPHLLPTERIEIVGEWLILMEDKLSK